MEESVCLVKKNASCKDRQKNKKYFNNFQINYFRFQRKNVKSERFFSFLHQLENFASKSI